MTLDSLTEKLFEGRTEALGITIDGPHSLDLDDAIWLERNNDGYLVQVSIADVGAVVTAGSETDQRALEQGWTRYFANSNRPMLPRILAEDLLSLHERKKRPTLTVSIPLDAELEIGEPTIKRTFLINARKFSYQEADELMNSAEDLFLGTGYRLARGLFEKRKAAGALVFFDRRTGLHLTEEGRLILLDKTERYNSNLIIQEFMILANRVLAEYFVRNDIPVLFRNHTARAAMPDRGELLNDLKTILSAGDPNRTETFFQRLNLVLNRASYGSTLSGHYGLNLPAYLHFTSPLRRYADLVNQRQLVATLTGENLPYALEDLNTIAVRINGLEESIKNGRAAYFANETRAETRKVLRSGQLDTLDAKSFYKVLKAAAIGTIVPELEEQIYVRLENNNLQARDLYTILLESEKDEAWTRIRSKALAWLEKNPFHATTILMMATQALSWSLPTYETRVQGPDHNSTFTAVGCLEIEGQKYTSELQTASSRKEAEQYAAISLLENILGIESKSRTVVGERQPVRDDDSSNTNYKGILQERCQRQGWPLPSYETSREGQPHLPLFQVMAKVTIDDNCYVSDPFKELNLRRAEQLAAGNLLEKLPPLERALPSTPKPFTKKSRVADPQHISSLEGFYSSSGLSRPEYHFTAIEGGFRCECTALTPDGTPKTYVGEGLSKQFAKRNAAELAHLDLRQFYKGS